MATPKILVVDDQPINVQLLKRKLEREGMTVAADGSGDFLTVQGVDRNGNRPANRSDTITITNILRIGPVDVDIDICC